MDEITQLKIQTLTYARQKIERGEVTYICYALESYYASQKGFGENAGQTPALNMAYVQLTQYIHRGIAPYMCYQNWLSSRSAAYCRLNRRTQQQAAKEGRLAWIDYMLNQLQKDTPNASVA